MSVVINGVSKVYGSQRAVDDISFTVQKGEILGFLGPNGAGKSTTMKMITGFLTPDDGVIEVLGEEVRPNDIASKKNIGYLSESNPLYTDMYVREYLLFNASIHRLQNPKSRIDDLLEKTGLIKEANKTIGTLSKGYKQRVGLAQAMLHDPQVLILDEPTSGLDMNQLVDIRALIKSMQTEKTIIFSTHIMQEVQALCSRVIIINEGKIIADDPIEKLQASLSGDNILHIELTEISDEPIRNLSLINNVVGVVSETPGHFRITYSKEYDVRPEIFNMCVSKGYVILGMQLATQDVEQVFHQLTKKSRI